MKTYSMIISGCILCSLTLSSLTSCNGSDDIDGGGNNIPELTKIQLTDIESNATEALNDFGFRFFKSAVSLEKELNVENGNMSVSPISAEMALSILANVMDQESEEAFLNTIGANNISELNATCNKLLRYLQTKSNGADVRMPNSVWYCQDLNPQDEWRNDIAAYFYAPVVPLDFKDKKSVRIINDWCNENTNGLIPEIIDKISDNADVYLLNAMYFNGVWQIKFDKNKTTADLFKGRDTQSDVDMMHSKFETLYFEGEEYDCVYLFFKGNTRISLILPKNNTQVADIIKDMSFSDYKSIHSRCEEAIVNLVLPKFEIKNDLMLNEPLSQIGINLNIDGAKLGLIRRESVNIQQKLKMRVDEDGAEMAAVTIVGTYGSPGGSSLPPREVTMTFNRPFIYFVENSVTGSILMAGTVNNL